MIEVLSPAGERRQLSLRLAKSLPSLSGKVAGLLANGKANSREFIRLVEADLRAHHGIADAVVLGKLSAGMSASPETLERLKSCDFAVTAFAD